MNRLRTRLILSFLAVTLVTLCGVSGALLVILRNNPIEERIAYLELYARAQSIANSLRRAPGANPASPTWTPTLAQIAQEEILRIAWTDLDGQVLFDSEHLWDAQNFAVLDHLRLRVHERRAGAITQEGKRWLVVALPWLDRLTPRGFLIVATDAPRFPFLQQFRDTLAGPLLQAGAVAFMLAVLLALLISRSIARPLQHIAGAARALADGDLEARAPVSGPDEMRALARAFNNMARRVQSGQQAQQDLVANVAHDLRTPLTSIQGFAQALVDGTAAAPESRAQAAGAIYEEAQRMRQMTDALLDLARFDAGQVQLHLEAVDLVALARKRVELFQPQATAAGILLKLHAEQPLLIVGDRERLTQALDNLLQNALAHTEAEDRVTVTANAAPPWAELSVADTGPGIPADVLPRIFERFYRGDKSRGSGGAGLGLAIVQEIAQAHGGSVYAESVEGVGSRFVIRLPAQPG